MWEKRIVEHRPVWSIHVNSLLKEDYCVQEFEQLFTQKGGQQSCVSKDKLYNHMRKLKWGQWRARLTKAIVS